MLRRIPNTPEQLKSILEEIIAVHTGNDFVTFEIKDVAPIAVAKKYAGIGASMIARNFPEGKTESCAAGLRRKSFSPIDKSMEKEIY